MNFLLQRIKISKTPLWPERTGLDIAVLSKLLSKKYPVSTRRCVGDQSRLQIDVQDVVPCERNLGPLWNRPTQCISAQLLAFTTFYNTIYSLSSQLCTANAIRSGRTNGFRK